MRFFRAIASCSWLLTATAGCGGDADSATPAAPSSDAGADGTAPEAGVDGAGDDALVDAAEESPVDAGHEASEADSSDGPVWQEPACTSVAGTWAVTFTRDEGATVAPGEGTLGGVEYTYGLAALDTPNVLVAEHAGRLLRSEDAGCTWSDIGPSPSTITTLAAAQGGRVYGFQQNADVLFRVDGMDVTSLASPTPALRGLGVDAGQGEHVLVGGDDGQVWESVNGGETFEAYGVPAPKGCFYAVVFDPTDLRHIVCGTMEDGTFVTMDGAQTWTASEGDAVYANTFSIAISPADSDVVWIEGFQLGWHDGQQIGPEGRRIWRSEDGGLTFTPVIEEESTSAQLFNGNLLAAHPSDTGVLYFTFGTPPVAGMASESFLYRFDASTATLEEHKQEDIDSYDAIAFSPANPEVIYLGKTSERPGGY